MESQIANGKTGPRVKGVAFRTIDTCFTELCGPGTRAHAHEVMLRGVSEGYRYGTLLPASWYPIAWYRDVFRAFRVASGAGVELPRQIGMMAVRHDMQGVHKRLLTWLVSPQKLLGLSQRVFSTYYDQGVFEVAESRSGYVRVHVEGCVDWDHNMWTEMLGSCESLLEVAGAKHVRMRVLGGGGDGDAHFDLESHWTMT